MKLSSLSLKWIHQFSIKRKQNGVHLINILMRLLTN
jgi:hypothetical protein